MNLFESIFSQKYNTRPALMVHELWAMKNFQFLSVKWQTFVYITTFYFY